MTEVPQRVLIVEDEQHLADGLRFNLEAEGYLAEVVDTGEGALERLLGPAQLPIHLVVLDVMLPGKDGFAVVSELRAAREFVPVLMLTARGRPEDVLRGFGAGADDYLPKPAELAILLARIRGLLRRSGWVRRSQDRYTFAGKTIDFDALELRVDDRKLPLTLMEANLLRYLIAHEGHAVSRKAMLEDVWGVREDTDTRPIDNFIVRLRRYIEQEPGRPRHLLTVRGVGYRFRSHPAARDD
jgi:DNA-binding response OmpR family regulator